MKTYLARTLSATAFFSAVLVLSACTKTRTLTVGDQAAVEAAEKRADDAQNALMAARNMLAQVQAAQKRVIDAPENAEAQAALRETLTDAENAVEVAETGVAELPATAATAAVRTALASTRMALISVRRLYSPSEQVSLAQASARPAQMHDLLSMARTAVARAQTDVAAAQAALEEMPNDAASMFLATAQSALATTQLSLLPQLARALDEAQARPPAPTAAEEALRSARTGLTEAQAATGRARTELAAAQAALEKVEADFQATAAVWGDDGDTTTDEEKTAAREAAQTRRQEAQTALAAAQTTFVNAREAERMAAATLATAAAAALAALTDAATDDQRTEVNAGVEAAAAAETATRAWAATRIAADPGLAAPPLILASAPALVPTSVPIRPDGAPFTARVTLTPREPTDPSGCTVLTRCRNPDPLDIATDAVAWAAGKTVLSPAATGESDHFPLRAISMRGDVRHSYEGDTDDSGGTTPKVPVVQSATDIDDDPVAGAGITGYQRHYLNPVTSSIRFTPDGMVFRTGGEGTVMGLFKHDLDRSSGSGRDGINSPGNWGTQDSGNNVMSDDCSGNYEPFCYDFNRSDAEISWGAPYADPDGEPNYYWASRYGLSGNQPQPDPEDKDGRLLAKHGALGDLRVWLSNHGGLDAGPKANDAGDDADRYLSYAAYGLFVHTDYVTEFPRPGFFQGFHFGYDAFRDAGNMKATEGTPSIAATFRGRTMGMILHPRSNSVGSEDAPHVGHFTRLRGDVTLNACIGAGACTGNGIPTGANRIMGKIANLQALDNGIWQKYAFLTNAPDDPNDPAAGSAILLVEDDIEADGSYRGDANTWNSSWNRGEYSGALYGPADELETAGWWRIETDSTHQNRHVAAFGSFGACQAEHCRVPAP